MASGPFLCCFRAGEASTCRGSLARKVPPKASTLCGKRRSPIVLSAGGNETSPTANSLPPDYWQRRTPQSRETLRNLTKRQSEKLSGTLQKWTKTEINPSFPSLRISNKRMWLERFHAQIPNERGFVVRRDHTVLPPVHAITHSPITSSPQAVHGFWL